MTGSVSATGSHNGNNGDDNESSSKKSTDIAPIVGGVVGGVAGGIVSGLVVFFWLRHKRNAMRDVPTSPVDPTANENKQYSDKPAGLQVQDHGVPAIEYNQPLSPHGPASPKVYDPDDPSTFPDNFVAPYPAPASPHQPPTASGTINLPESTALSGSTGTSTGSRTALSTGSTSTARGSQSTSPNGSNSDTGNGTTSSKKSTNIAPIVGGVVGGVVGVIIIGLALFFWLRRRRNSARYAPTSPVDLTAGEYSPGYNDKSHPTVYNEVPSASPLTTTEYSHPIPPPLPSPKVYDPDDPSTFPESSDTQAPSSHDSAAYASPVHAHLATVPYTYTPPSPYQPATSANSTAAYKGVPEL
ncbi:hypothetical protein TRAPUB_12947 [Trametes pubescens]|uniref:Carcinoembryonic antigen-related cell adhesion molecule 1 n=1 Tax=Trametes pubescens TaxID=154538 RepID=A0A1M2VSB7_TRAPU|nr:hypothetical protein TRAPUB_12947 [Trametes pubescens]